MQRKVLGKYLHVSHVIDQGFDRFCTLQSLHPPGLCLNHIAHGWYIDSVLIIFKGFDARKRAHSPATPLYICIAGLVSEKNGIGWGGLFHSARLEVWFQGRENKGYSSMNSALGTWYSRLIRLNDHTGSPRITITAETGIFFCHKSLQS